MAVQDMESKVVVVDTEKGRLVVVVIYRSPSGSMVAFLQHMDSLIALMPLHVPTVITGDFNDNLAVNTESSLTTLMNRYGFEQLVKEPTTDAGTLVDHIYFNRQTYESTNLFTGVQDIYYSDHDFVYMTTDIV